MIRHGLLLSSKVTSSSFSSFFVKASCIHKKAVPLYCRTVVVSPTAVALRCSSSSTTTTTIPTQPKTTTETATTHFGFENVAIDEKEGRVKEVFNNVADSYDVMNDVMSGGIHRYWKDELVRLSHVQSIAQAIRRNIKNTTTAATTNGFQMLDVAGGTGDVAFRLIKAAQCEERTQSSGRDPISVTVCDINVEMLRVGEQRARKRSSSFPHHIGSLLIDSTQALSFVEGNAQSLPFPDNTFDLYTIAFGLRNVTNIDRALQEAFRVLRPGGRFMCLEFSQVQNCALLRNLYDVYSFYIIPTMGHYVANDSASYQYLVESIRKFPNQQHLLQKMQQIAGFHRVQYTNMTGGIVAIHQGYKPIH